MKNKIFTIIVLFLFFTIFLFIKPPYTGYATYEEAVCGDNICTTPLEDDVTCPEDCMKKVNWWFVIILLALLIGGIYYLNFYKGKLSFKEIASKKPDLFSSKSDENNLRNYVRKSLTHNIPKSRIKNILLAKGWTEKQIDHIFRTI